jgi:RNA polymerase sigma-70 factor (ECF subfamily)
LIDWRRLRGRQPSVPTDPERVEVGGWVGDAEDEAMTGLATEAAIELVAALEGDQAEVVLLRVLGGLPVEDVARIVGKKPGTIRVIQHRALRRLAQQMTREDVTK